MHSNRHPKTILHKILSPLILVVLLQACLLYLILFYGGPLQEADSNALHTLTDKTSARAGILEDDMIQRWANLDECQDTVSSIAAATVAQSSCLYADLGSNPDIASDFLSSVSRNLISLLRKNGVNDAFIILNGSDSSENPNQTYSKSTLRLRDYSPNSISANNEDIFIENAPASVCKHLALPLDIYWSSTMEIKPQDSFYYNPLHAYQADSALGYKDAAYWDGPITMAKDDVPALTYTQPLVAPDGAVYGVLGISLSIDYLYALLPYDELNSNDTASYLLVKSTSDSATEQSYQTILSSGPAVSYLLKSPHTLRLNTAEISPHIYEVINDVKTKDPIYASVIPFQLYNTNTPFTTQSLSLVALSAQHDVLSFSLNLKRNLGYMLFASLLIGILASCLIAYRLTSPIVALSKTLKESDPSKPLLLKPIYIREIDHLTTSMEELSASVAAYSSKVSSILDMVSVPIAAFERTTDSPSVFCSKNFFQMIGKGELQAENFSIPFKEFESYMSSLKQHMESFSITDGSGIYKLRDAQRNSHWFRLLIHGDTPAFTGVITDITLEIAEKHRLEYERDYDILTNLFNRRAFLNSVSKIFATPRLLKNAVLIMMDLDNLKYINDTYGHDWGDEYLKSTAIVLKNLNDRTAITARMSGDEFNIFFYGYDTRESLEASIASMRTQLNNTFLHAPDDTDIRLRSSAGAAWYPDDSLTLEELRKFADFAMYQAKKLDKGSIYNFNQSNYRKDSYLLMGKEDLNLFLEQRLVDYAFQPIVSVLTGEVFAYEALMRPKIKSLSSPTDLINIAKAQSLLQKVESLTWLTAPDIYFNQHKKCHTTDPLLFVNSIPNQVLTSAEGMEFSTRFSSCLSRIVIELTEVAQMDSLCLERKRAACEKYHMHIALDDYGSGYNSENVLLSIMPTYVKIDIDIIHNIDQDSNRLGFLENMITYFKSRNILIIAEGVETKEELEVLVHCNVDYIQGYYFGRPNLIPSLPNEDALLALSQARLTHTPSYDPQTT